MRNIYSVLYVITAFFSFNQIGAQVSLYNFNQSMGTYVAITGGTVFGNTNTDDEVFINPGVPLGQGVGATGSGLPIGFNFNYDGIVFDRIGINANGFLYLGHSTVTPVIDSWISNANIPISATTTAVPVKQYKICAFGYDIQSQTGLAAEIRAQTIGSSPNRSLVVQWTNYRKYNNVGDDFSFQIRLCESSNFIDVIYGNFINNATAATAQVGLRGSAPNNYNNRFVNALNTWSASALGISNVNVANFNSALVPPSGLIYRWIPPPACNGAPTGNSVVSNVTSICPFGSASLTIANPYVNSGITYQWQSSGTSSLGPYSPVAGSAGAFFNPTSIVNNTWYQCIITCANSSVSTIAVPFQVLTTGAAIDNVPYTEGFESLILNNQLPTCSWAASQPTTVCQTYTVSASNNRTPHTGNKFAAFKGPTNAQGDYFYTGGVQLYSGITYSSSFWYTTDGTFNWTNLELMYGNSQTSAGLNPISSVTNIASGYNYMNLSNTFTVPSNGVYLFAVKAIGNVSAQYLSFDDLAITIPCNLNQPSITVVSSATSVCEGSTISITASGADLYSWSNGSLSNSITFTATTSGVYALVGTNTLTGCSVTWSTNINVKAKPQISILSNSLIICRGDSTQLYAIGAQSYSWSSINTSSLITVKPISTTNFSVVGINTLGCSSNASIQITVLPSPTLNANISPTLVCAGESVFFLANGASTYTWYSNPEIYSGNGFSLMPLESKQYTLTGKGTNGCKTSTYLNLIVEECVGLHAYNKSNFAIQVLPNPFQNQFQIYCPVIKISWCEISDANGKLLLRQNLNETFTAIDMTEFASGLYYLKMSDGTQVERIKLIKN